VAPPGGVTLWKIDRNHGTEWATVRVAADLFVSRRSATTCWNSRIQISFPIPHQGNPFPHHASVADARITYHTLHLAVPSDREAEQDPPVGRVLRIVPSRRTKDGTFLTDLVEQGLLHRVTGTAAAPFEATYALTERGEYAAEYGECDFPPKAKSTEPTTTDRPKVGKKGKGPVRGKK
jgi:hypothetical protein